MKGFTQTPIHVFLPRFVEISKAEVTKQVCGMDHKKGWYFVHSLWILEQSSQKF